MADDTTAEPLHRMDGPFFTGEAWPDRVEVKITHVTMTDSDNVEEFGEALLGICNHSQACRVLVDISKLQLLSSSGIGKFILLHRALSRDGGTLVLVDPSETFGEVLHATNLDRFFLIADTMDDARSLITRPVKPDEAAS